MKPTSTLEAVVRGAAGVLGGVLGYLIGRWFVSQHVLNESINVVYLTLVGLLLGYLLSGPLVGLSERAVRWSRALPPDAVLAAGLGTTAALVLTVLLNSVLEQVPGFSWQVSVLMTVMLAAPMMGAALLVGLLVSVFQALTQIQEQTLIFVPKILAIFVTLLLALPFMADSMHSHMMRISSRIIGG